MENQLKSPARVFSGKPSNSSRKAPGFIKRRHIKSKRVVPVFLNRRQKASMPSMPSMASDLTVASDREVQRQTTVPQRHREVLVHDCGYWFDTTCPVCLQEAYPLDNYLEIPEVDSPAPLGMLEAKLPREIIDMILYRCDILSLTRLRSVNRRGRQLVSENLQYKVIVQYVPRLIRYMLELSLRSKDVCEKITLGEMYFLATEKGCYQCLGFSIYIDLVERKRICVRCFEEDQRCYGPNGYRNSLNAWKGVTIEDLKFHYGILEGDQAGQSKARLIKDSRLLNHYLEKFGSEIPDIPYDEQEHRKIKHLAVNRHPEMLSSVSEEDPPHTREQFAKLLQVHSLPWKRVIEAYNRYLFHAQPNLLNRPAYRDHTYLFRTRQSFGIMQMDEEVERKSEELTVRAPWLDPETYEAYWE